MVDDWKDCWKWFSVHVALIIALFNALQGLMPQFQALMSPTWFAGINAALGLVVILARVTAQGVPNA
jgi:hypothetical protein